MEQQLYNAAAQGALENVKDLLQNYPETDINWQENGKTPLLIAASWGHWDVVELLLEKGAKCVGFANKIDILLYFASYYLPRCRTYNSGVFFNNYTKTAKHNALKIAKMFIQKVVKQNMYTDLLPTVHQDEEKLSQLEADTQQDLPDNIMSIVLYYNHFATTMLLSEAIALTNSELRRYRYRLIHCRKVGDNDSEKNGLALYNAAAYGDIDQVKKILTEASNLNINWRNAWGSSTLFIAAAWGLQDEAEALSESGDSYYYYDIAKLLIERDADINLINYKHQSVLYIASSWGHWDIVKLLIAHLANTAAKKKLLHIACYTQPREGEVVRDPGTYYSAHTISNKRGTLELAKKYIALILEKGEYLDILTTVQEDYKTLTSADIHLQPQMSVPDDIMSIAIYYNHFATVVELLKATIINPSEFPEDLQKYHTALLQERELTKIKLNQQSMPNK